MLAGKNINLSKNCIEHMLNENLNAKKQISRWDIFILTPARPQAPALSWLAAKQSREDRSKPTKRPSIFYHLSWLNTIKNKMKTFIMITLLVFIFSNQGWTLCIGSGCGRNVVNENGVKTEAWNTVAYPGGAYIAKENNDLFFIFKLQGPYEDKKACRDACKKGWNVGVYLEMSGTL